MKETKVHARRRRTRSATDRPTVDDVARRAGVSPMTVSRVINRGAYVSQTTREKVDAAIAELGYVPNQSARNLAGGKEIRIALLHSNPSSGYLSEFLMGSLGQASADNAQLVVEHCEDGVLEDDLVRKVASHRASAVLMPPPLCDNETLLAKLHEAGLPMAQIATGRPSPIAHAVMIDDARAAEEIARHLIALGHRKIGFIAGNPNQTVSALRKVGFEKALADAGLEQRPQWFAEGDFSYRSGLVAAERLLSLPDRPTAIMASNDDMAAAVVAAAHRHSLNVPGDLSVCGFDDTALATTIWPELTTVRQPIAEMAQIATALLVADVRKGRAPEQTVRHERIEHELILRESLGPPPHGTG